MADNSRFLDAAIEKEIENANDIETVGKLAELNYTFENNTESFPDVILITTEVINLTMLGLIYSVFKLIPEIKIIIYGPEESELIMEAIKHGAWGYLPSGSQPETVLQAIRASIKGEAVLTPRLARRLVDEISNKYEK